MFQKILMVIALFAVASAYNYDNDNSIEYTMTPQSSGNYYKQTALPIYTNQQPVQYYPVANQGYVKPTNVLIDAQVIPINLVHQSRSSPIRMRHVHIPSAGSFRQTNSIDEAHRHVHTVTKPIIQEVQEIVAPQRIVRQRVLPVQEQVQTQVARQAAIPIAQAVPVFPAIAPVSFARTQPTFAAVQPTFTTNAVLLSN